MRYVCVFICLAAFCPAAPGAVQGELVSEGLKDYSNLAVEISVPGATFAERSPVSIDGRFEVRDVPQGNYLLRVTDRQGDTVHQEYGSAFAAPSITIRLPKSAQPQRPGSGSVSIQELRHRPVKAAVKAFNKSVQRTGAGKIEEALELLEQAVSLDPHYIPALNNLGASYVRTGRYSEAAIAFARAIAESPSNAMLHANLAHALLYTGNHSVAEAEARQAFELDKTNTKAAYYIGLSLLSQKKFTPETVGWLRKGRTVGARAELALAAALSQTGADREAREILKQCQQSDEGIVAAEARLLLSRLR